MNQLVKEGIYKPVRMYDYQATCFQRRDTGNWASTLSRVRIVNNFLFKAWCNNKCIHHVLNYEIKNMLHFPATYIHHTLVSMACKNPIIFNTQHI